MVRRVALLAVVIVVLLAFTAILTVNSLSVVQRVTFIDDIKGTVEVREPGQRDFRPLTASARVLAGTLLRTQANSSALLHWADGTKLQAGPGTTLTIMKCRLDKRTNAAISLFKLDLGRVLVRVLRSLTADSKFEIRTPTATAGVRGTGFSVAVAPGGDTEVLVYDGTVAVDAGAKTLGVTKGQAFMVNGAGNVTAVRELSTEEQKEWEKQKL